MNARRKQIIFPLVSLVICAAIVGGLMATKKSPEKKEDEKPVPFVSTEVIELAPLRLYAESQGIVQSRFQTRLIAQVSGEIVSVADVFERGGQVHEGELLAQIDPFDYQVRLQQANASLASARAAFILERAQGQVAEAEWEKITNAKPSDLGLRKPQQEQALAAVKAAEAALQQAKKELERTKILAPFDALVTERSVSLGTYVNVGGALGELVDTRVAHIRLPLSQKDFSVLDKGGINADVDLSAMVAGEQKTWRGKIIRNEGLVDNDSRMVYLLAEILQPYGNENDFATLPFGTYVTAKIFGKELNAAARVPRHLLQDNKIPLVKDGKLALIPIRVASYEGKYAVIENGLNNGDLLITSSLATPMNGMEVQWQNDAQATAHPEPTLAAKKIHSRGEL